MKKLIITLLIIMLVSFTASIVLVAVQLKNIDQLRQSIIISVDDTKEIEISNEIKSIIVDSRILEDINVYSTEDEKLKAELSGGYISVISKEVKIEVTEKRNSIYIDVKENGVQRFLSSIIYETGLTLNIYIPESYKKELNIRARYDDIYIEDTILETLNIKGVDIDET